MTLVDYQSNDTTYNNIDSEKKGRTFATKKTGPKAVHSYPMWECIMGTFVV